jgi:hypothetical protein
LRPYHPQNVPAHPLHVALRDVRNLYERIYPPPETGDFPMPTSHSDIPRPDGDFHDWANNFHIRVVD